MSSESSPNTRKIVETAVALFKKEGYDTVSIRRICEEAGVPRSSFYTVFSGKEDIITYILKRVKVDFEKILPEFIAAPNDLERIWLLTRAFMEQSVENGSEFVKAVFVQELKHHYGFFDLTSAFNEWLIPLLANCQAMSIVRNQGKPEELIPLQVNLAKALVFDWACTGGDFPLLETLRRQIEIFLDVAPEYQANRL